MNKNKYSYGGVLYNKNVKAFTLIELLAVIVILAVISLIATPIILGIINDTKEKAFRLSLNNVERAYEIYAVQKSIKPGTIVDIKDLPLDKKNLTGKVMMNEEGKIELKQITDGTYSAEGTIDDLTMVKGPVDELVKNKLTIKVNTNYLSRSVVVSVDIIEGIATSYSYKIEGPDNYKEEVNNVTSNTTTFNKLKQDTEYVITVTVKNKAGITREKTVTDKTTKLGEITLDLTPKDEYIKSGKVTIKYPTVEGTTNYYKWDGDEDFTPVTGNSVEVDAKNGTLIAVIKDDEEVVLSKPITISNVDNIPPVVTLSEVRKTTNSITIPYTVIEEHIDEVTCKYSDVKDTYTTSGVLGENVCTLSNELKNNKTYYYEICVTDVVGNKTCETDSTDTEEITNPSINITHTPSNAGLETTNGYSKEEVASITFTSTNMTTTTYYIKSTLVGTTNNNVIGACGTEDMPGTCTNTSTTSIAANTWYEVSGDINVTYNTETDENGTVYALTYDGKNYSGASTGTILKIASTEPTITFVTNGNNTYAKLQSSVVNVTVNNSGINTLKYKWTTNNTESASNGTNFNSGDTLTTPNNLNGTYYLCVYVKDNVGNEKNQCSNKFMLDTTGPTYTTSVNLGEVTITAEDDLSGLHSTSYSCDGVWQTSNVCIFETNGSHTVNVRDALENAGTQTTVNIITSATPVLGSLKPVVYENNSWKIVSETSDWYDYGKQEWGNAVLLKSGVSKNVGDTVNVSSDIIGMFVWIPKFEYKIEGTYGKGGTSATSPGEIEVKFIGKSKTTADSGYIIHPAFNFGGVEQSGIWVGKFETSHETLSESTTANNLECSDNNCSNADGLRVLPNVVSLRYNNVSNFFYAAQSLDNRLNISGDLHMMKNSEWGAAAYLSQSKCGKYGNPSYSGADKEVTINNNSSYITGGGDYANNTAQSTTGNITGIYDMSGGAWDSVMGNYNSTIKSSGFSSLPVAKYYDNYTGTTSATACSGGVCYGHALSEIAGWYGDYANFVSSGGPWFLRGGSYGSSASAGVFASSYSGGNYDSGSYSFRVVLSQN